MSNLGPTDSSHIAGWVVARPIISSFLLLLITIILVRYVYPPILRMLSRRPKMDLSRTKWAGQISNLALFMFVVVVSAYVTIAHCVGSSMLMGAFCAGGLMGHCWKNSNSNTNPTPQIPLPLGRLTRLPPHSTRTEQCPFSLLFRQCRSRHPRSLAIPSHHGLTWDYLLCSHALCQGRGRWVATPLDDN